MSNKSEIKTIKSKRGVGLGVFDGCHIGHSELIATLVSECDKLNLISTAFTFKNGSFKTSDKFLTDDISKGNLLRKKGIQEVIYQDFTEEFSSYSPEKFLEKVIKTELKAGLIVVGFNFKFGKNRTGDVLFLQDWCNQNFIKLIVLPPVKYHEKTISSSSIKELLQKGNLKKANALLGRKYEIDGMVIPGQGLGKKIGFPTANFIPDINTCLPKNGVYSTRVICDGKSYEGITNIGLRPSVPETNKAIIVETSILDEEKHLYGKKIKVEFWNRIRDEKKFNSIEELQSAISKDIKTATLYHENAGELYEIASINEIKFLGLKTTRFTTDMLNIRLTLPLDKQLASEYKLLSRVISATCAKYPSKAKLSGKLDNLYGADINIDTTAHGNALLIDFTADALHSWHDGDYSFKQVAQLLFDIIGNPDLNEDGVFRKDIVESEKLGLLSEIRARENDKGQYSFDRAIELYTKNSDFEARSFGEMNIINSIDGKILKKAYGNMLKTAQIKVSIAGRYDKNLVNEIISSSTKIFKDNKPIVQTILGKFPAIYEGPKKTIEKLEKKKVQQARVCFILKGKSSSYSLIKPVHSLLNTILGGDVDSLLFRTVREEYGLAYSVFSARLKYHNAIYMGAGVSPDKILEAANAMVDQVDKLKTGKIDKSMIASAKKKMKTSYLGISDSLRGVLSHALKMENEGVAISAFDLAESVLQIELDDLVLAAQDYELSVKYILTAKG